MRDGDYWFDGLPLSPVSSGTTVLVTGPIHDGVRDLGLRLLAGTPREGAIVVTTNERSNRIVENCKRVGIDVSPEETAVLDCVGEDDANVPAKVLTVSGPSDLTGIGMRFSDVYRDFGRRSIDRVRTGILSVSTLLLFSDLRTVSRFVHTLVGRIDSVDGFGVLLVDPSNHEPQTVSTLSQFCHGRIEVRDNVDGPELRVRGLPDQSRDWVEFDPFGR